jgi:hypothetical protein
LGLANHVLETLGRVIGSALLLNTKALMELIQDGLWRLWTRLERFPNSTARHHAVA